MKSGQSRIASCETFYSEVINCISVYIFKISENSLKIHKSNVYKPYIHTKLCLFILRFYAFPCSNYRLKWIIAEKNADCRAKVLVELHYWPPLFRINY